MQNVTCILFPEFSQIPFFGCNIKVFQNWAYICKRNNGAFLTRNERNMIENISDLENYVRVIP